MRCFMEIWNDVPRVHVGFLSLDLPDSHRHIGAKLSRFAPKANLRLVEVTYTKHKLLHVVQCNSLDSLQRTFFNNGRCSLYPLRAVAWVTTENIFSNERTRIIKNTMPHCNHLFYW